LLYAALETDRPRDAVVAEMALGRRDEARLPSKLSLLENHHLIGPDTFKIAGPCRRNIPERHHDPPGAPSRAFINAMGPGCVALLAPRLTAVGPCIAALDC